MSKALQAKIDELFQATKDLRSSGLTQLSQALAKLFQARGMAKNTASAGSKRFNQVVVE